MTESDEQMSLGHDGVTSIVAVRQVGTSHSAIVGLDRARAALAGATTIEEVKDVRDKAEALRSYARQAGDGLREQNHCAEIKIRAERRAGELLAQSGKHPPGPPKSKKDRSLDATEPPKLSELGITKSQSSRWQCIARLKQEVFERYLAETQEANSELTSAKVVQLARSLEPRKKLRRKKGKNRGPAGSREVPVKAVVALSVQGPTVVIEFRDEIIANSFAEGLRLFIARRRSPRRPVRGVAARNDTAA